MYDNIYSNIMKIRTCSVYVWSVFHKIAYIHARTLVLKWY